VTNLLEHNRTAWNEEVKKGNQWTIPATKEEIEKAKGGNYQIVLTPFKPVPEEWLGDIKGKRILCLGWTAGAHPGSRWSEGDGFRQFRPAAEKRC